MADRIVRFPTRPGAGRPTSDALVESVLADLVQHFNDNNRGSDYDAGVQFAIDTVRDHQRYGSEPVVEAVPPELPAVLSSVEDVARVAAAAGLEHTLSRRRPEVIRWVCRSTSALPELRGETRDVDGALRVVLLVERTDDHHGLAWSAEWFWNGQGGGGIPLGPVWSAIQAARVGELDA